MMKIKLNMRMLLAMVLGIQRDQVIAATLWPVVTEPCLLIGRGVITKNEPRLVIGRRRIIRPPLGQNVEVRLGAEVVMAVGVLAWERQHINK